LQTPQIEEGIHPGQGNDKLFPEKAPHLEEEDIHHKCICEAEEECLRVVAEMIFLVGVEEEIWQCTAVGEEICQCVGEVQEIWQCAGVGEEI